MPSIAAISLQASINSQVAAGFAMRDLADFHSDIGLAMMVDWNGISALARGPWRDGKVLL
jgi:hypothetical protein